MFEMMDKDASGGISKAELAQWIKSTQEMDSEADDVEEEVVAAEFNRIDSNQDGQLRSVHVLLSKLYLPPIYLNWICAILQFEISSSMNWIFGPFQTVFLQAA